MSMPAMPSTTCTCSSTLGVIAEHALLNLAVRWAAAFAESYGCVRVPSSKVSVANTPLCALGLLTSEDDMLLESATACCVPHIGPIARRRIRLRLRHGLRRRLKRSEGMPILAILTGGTARYNRASRRVSGLCSPTLYGALRYSLWLWILVNKRVQGE